MSDQGPSDHVFYGVVDADPQARSQMAALLPDGVEVTSYSTADSLAADAPPVGRTPLILMGPSCGDAAGLESTERLVRSRPDISVVLMVEEISTGVLQQALRAGVKDVVSWPPEPDAVAASIRRIEGATVRAAVAPVSDADLGQVITVFSTKGGAGKSVIASNLAVLLAQKSDKPVVLVDADLQFGDLAVMLKLVPNHTIVDAIGAIDRLDAALLENLLVRHEPSGVLVLPAPLEPAFADQISSTDMRKIIHLLRQIAGYVVVDTAASFNDVVLGLIEVSDTILLLAGMDIPNIKNVKIGLQTLRLLNTPMSKVKLVLNRANAKVKLDVTEVERTLQMKAESLLPSEVAVPQSVNKGVPVVLEAPRSGIAKALDQLAQKLYDEGK